MRWKPWLRNQFLVGGAGKGFWLQCDLIPQEGGHEARWKAGATLMGKFRPVREATGHRILTSWTGPPDSNCFRFVRKELKDGKILLFRKEEPGMNMANIKATRSNKSLKICIIKKGNQLVHVMTTYYQKQIQRIDMIP